MVVSELWFFLCYKCNIQLWVLDYLECVFGVGCEGGETGRSNPPASLTFLNASRLFVLFLCLYYVMLINFFHFSHSSVILKISLLIHYWEPCVFACQTTQQQHFSSPLLLPPFPSCAPCFSPPSQCLLRQLDFSPLLSVNAILLSCTLVTIHT